MSESNCIYCGHELVRVAHWGICPVCSKDYLASVTIEPEPPLRGGIGKGRTAAA